MLVYYLEYTCIVGWADRAHRAKDKTDNFVNDNAFAILNFIY